jgi:hypothetical protein
MAGAVLRLIVIPALAGGHSAFSAMTMADAPLLRRALGAIRPADVRSGILPSQSGFRRDGKAADSLGESSRGTRVMRA